MMEPRPPVLETRELPEAPDLPYPLKLGGEPSGELCRKCGFPLVLCMDCGERSAGCGEAICEECCR